MIDELAYRREARSVRVPQAQYLAIARWLGVLEAAANAAKWTPRVAASKRSSARVVTGRGIAVGTHHLQPNQGDRITYAAAVVDIEVNKDNGPRHREAGLWRDGLRAGDQSGHRREPDRRHVRARRRAWR